MQHQNPTSNDYLTSARSMNRSRLGVATILIVISVFAFGSLSAAAQSGRRSAPPPPAPTPTPEPTPAETKSTDKDKRAVTLLVGMDSSDTISIPQYLFDDVLGECAQRLDQGRSVKVNTERNMSRGDAIKAAKKESENPVVYLRLRTDNIGANSSSTADWSQLYIEYAIFSPETAKVVSTGNVYQGVNKGVITVPTGRTGTAAAEFKLKQAARDAADRILNALHISASPQ
jgi:hypothetical protein